MSEQAKMYFVMREYSFHPSNKSLWKLLSVGFETEQEAHNFIPFCKLQEPKCKQEFFVKVGAYNGRRRIRDGSTHGRNG